MRYLIIAGALLGAACAPGISTKGIAPVQVRRDYAACANADGEPQQIDRLPRGHLVVIVNNELGGVCGRIIAEGEAPFVYSKRIVLANANGQAFIGFERYDRFWRVGPVRNPRVRVQVQAVDAAGNVVAQEERFLYVTDERQTRYVSIKKEYGSVRIEFQW